MSDDFQQTVDLKLKNEERKTRAQMRVSNFEATRNAREIDEVYRKKEGERNEDLKKIEKYKKPRVNENIFRRVVIILGLVIVATILYFMLFSGYNQKEAKQDYDWYAVKLINGEEYYGQVSDTKSDPVVITNVFYNYDQIKDGVVDKNYSPEMSTNLRLVKRGKEIHGPDGSMSVVRGQVIYMEPLKDDSKVLKAILNYEK